MPLNPFARSRSRPPRFDADPEKAKALVIVAVVLAVLAFGVLLIIRGLA